MRSSRQRHPSYDARMLAVADELLEEFEQLPLLTVVRAINSARGALASPAGDPPAPETVSAVAREELAALVQVA